MYELFEHTADLGLRVEAPDLNGLFRDAAAGFFSILVEEIPPDDAAQRREFSIEGGQTDYLILDWLNEMLYVFDTEKLLLRDFDVRVDSAGLKATARVQPLDLERHRMLREVKAITYHRLRVERTEGGWVAEVIVDI